MCVWVCVGVHKYICIYIYIHVWIIGSTMKNSKADMPLNKETINQKMLNKIWSWRPLLKYLSANEFSSSPRCINFIFYFLFFLLPTFEYSLRFQFCFCSLGKQRPLNYVLSWPLLHPILSILVQFVPLPRKKKRYKTKNKAKYNKTK